MSSLKTNPSIKIRGITINTRIAPSPSGNYHIGTARTAYLNWLVARSTGGKFILRIDDTNKDKSHPEYVDVILDSMKWLGLDYDSLVFQSDRFDLYRKIASDMLDANNAIKDDGAIKLVCKDVPSEWKDEVVGTVHSSKDDIKNASETIIIRSDGSPTYHWASVIDDIELGIDYICRGSDHISNTLRQITLFNALGKPTPKFAHIGLIHQNGKKLSKSDGASSILYYKDKGYDPDAMLNFLVRMGWSPTVDDKTTAIIDRPKALDLILNGGKFRAASANMDIAKLESYDRKYKGRKGVWRTGAKLETNHI